MPAESAIVILLLLALGALDLAAPWCGPDSRRFGAQAYAPSGSRDRSSRDG